MLSKEFNPFVQKQLFLKKVKQILYPILCFEKCSDWKEEEEKKEPYLPYFLFEQNTLQYIAQSKG